MVAGDNQYVSLFCIYVDEDDIWGLHYFNVEEEKICYNLSLRMVSLVRDQRGSLFCGNK